MASKGKRGSVASKMSSFGILLGVVLVASPLLADWAFQFWANSEINGVTSVAEMVDPKTKARLLDQAHKWNRMIAGYQVDGELLDYDLQLKVDGTEAMGWIEIPDISVKLPYYHHDDDEAVLASGVGHNEATSLPVGGEMTNCVLSGHSGMVSSRMFDDLENLQAGSKFILHTLGDVYAYQVTRIENMLPADAAREMAVSENCGDEATLITCSESDTGEVSLVRTNSHRLIVHGVRCEYSPQQDSIDPVTQFFNNRTLPFLLALDVLLAAAFVKLMHSQINAMRNKRKESA